MDKKFVKVSDYHIKGINYYWVRKDQFNISLEELEAVGITGNYAYIHEDLIPVLKEVNSDLRESGYELIVKDGYRPSELYKLVKQKRYEIDGKENTDKTLNHVLMPHANGYTLDVSLINIATGEEEKIWDNKDWPNGVFVDYYRQRSDNEAKNYQRLQDLLIKTMLSHGFKLGSKREIWHFEYR